MKAFLKENIILVLGVSLPLLLTAVFFIANQVNLSFTEPPQYSVLFINNNNYGTSLTHKVIIRDKHAYLSYIPPKEDRHYNFEAPNLYLYNPAKDEIQEIRLPKTHGLEGKTELPIDELSTTLISTEIQSPDGYHFTHNYRGNRNLMTELFGGGYRRSHYVLKKEQKNVKIPTMKRYNSQFIGWVVPKNGE